MADRQYLTQLGIRSVDKEFSGLKTITRLYKVSAEGATQASIDSEVFRAYGTADEEFTVALLTKRKMEQVSVEPNSYITRLTEVYTEFTSGQKISVGEDQLIIGEDGRSTKIYRYVALASQAEGLAAAIGDTLSGRACSSSQVVKHGVGAEIIETYISAGKLAESSPEKNDGKLLLKTIVSYNQVPTTPSGYILFDTRVSNPLGIPTYTYSYAKGNGEIGRKTSYNQSTDQGTTGVTVITIQHLTASSVSTDPTSSPGGSFTKNDEHKRDEDGYRVWTITYVMATGQVSTRIRTRQDGLREVTFVTLGTRVAPDGIIIIDDDQLSDGYVIYTVTSIQTAAGGDDPTDATIVFERYVPFTYPGRAKTFSETVNGRTYLDVFRSPPVTTDVKAEVAVTYTTDNTIGSVSDYWNPSEWATLRAAWVGLGDNPQNQVTALTGYRSISATPVESTASVIGDGTSLSCLGNTVFGGEKARITCTGGPSDPGGTTKTLDVTIEPAFVSSTGTKYYRKTVVSAAIPAQDSLPV